MTPYRTNVALPHPTCADCEHAVGVAQDPHIVACSAHLEYFPADKLATCSAFAYHPEHHHCAARQD